MTMFLLKSLLQLNQSQVSVSVNVEGEGKVEFRLVYEELLQRQLDRYEHVVHVNLNQVSRQIFYLLTATVNHRGFFTPDSVSRTWQDFGTTKTNVGSLFGLIRTKV